MLQEASEATKATPDVEYAQAEGLQSVAGGLREALADPALAQRYASAYRQAGLEVPTVGQSDALSRYAADAMNPAGPGTYNGPNASMLSQYYNAAVNAGIDPTVTPLPQSIPSGGTPAPPQRVLRRHGGNVDPRYFDLVRRYRGGGGSRALTRALGG